MSIGKWFAVVLLTASLCGAGLARAESFSGTLSYSPAGPPDSGDGVWVQGRDWPGYAATIQWLVTNEDPVPGFPWKYTYRFALTGEQLQGGISHLVIEVSPESSIDDFTGFTGEALPEDDDPVKVQTVQSGNPSMPEDFWGIRFLPIQSDEFDMTWTFWSNRAPVWGDFYAKDGAHDVNLAYNYNKTGAVELGFVDPDSNDGTLDDVDPGLPPSANPVGLYHILRPDTVLIPEPSTVILLLGGALSMLAAGTKRRPR